LPVVTSPLRCRCERSLRRFGVKQWTQTQAKFRK
jgi:hypothetical protein